MTAFSVLLRFLLVAPMALWLSGCFPGGDSPADEEKDPHYLAGKNRLSSMDYEGAINAFESALTSNPKSAAAHLELGFLYEERRTNYAAAIYHFEKHLELRPRSNMTETIKQHIYSCKLDLAHTVSFALVSQQVQEEIRKLSSSNSVLLQQIQVLKAQLVEKDEICSNRVAQLQSAMASQAQARAQAQSLSQGQSLAPSDGAEIDRRPSTRDRASGGATSRSVSAPVSAPTTATPKLHIVKPGETLASISKKYNVKLSTLQAINPNVDPRKLKAGQVLNLPGK